jgi:hypothetical protein
MERGSTEDVATDAAQSAKVATRISDWRGGETVINFSKIDDEKKKKTVDITLHVARPVASGRARPRRVSRSVIHV